MMGSRRKARESALQLLFELEFNDADPGRAISRYWKENKVSAEVKEFGTWLVTGILSKRKELDETIQPCSENWRISRMAHVDRNILRIAVFELLHEETVAPAVIINEAIEIAKKYSGENASTFVNGILDAVRKKIAKSNKSTKEGRHGQAGPNSKQRKIKPRSRAKAE